MRNIPVYKFSELPEEIQDVVIENKRNERIHEACEIPWQYETLSSLKELFKRTNGVKLLDYSLGLCSYSYLKIDMDHGADLTGARALGWLENNLLNGLRLSRQKFLSGRRDYLRYGRHYRTGKIPPGPLTGYYADDVYIEAVRESIVKGHTLKEAFLSLANVYIELFQGEYDFYISEECIKEELHGSSEEYTLEGKEIY